MGCPLYTASGFSFLCVEWRAEGFAPLDGKLRLRAAWMIVSQAVRVNPGGWVQQSLTH